MRTHGLQLRVSVLLFGEYPRLVRVDVLVGFIRQCHGEAQRGGGLVACVGGGDRLQLRHEAGVSPRFRQDCCQLAIETLFDEAGAAAGQVDELADHVAVHPSHEVAQVEVEVIHAARGLGCEVIAQRFRREARIQIRPRHHEGAARLAHLGAVHGQVAVDVQPGGRAQASAVQHRRPEQAVEIDDVLADEVVELGIAVLAQVTVEIDSARFAQGLEAGEITNRCVQPDVEELARLAGNLEAEIRRVT